MGAIYSLEEIRTRLNCELLGEASVTFGQIAIDSRTLSSGDDFLFVALVGDRHDGP